MWKIVVTGLALLIAGAVKFAQHVNRTPTLEDYLAFRCGPGASALETGIASHSLISSLHCWGCPAMLIGAGLIAFAGFRSLRLGTGSVKALRS